ncbi:MAG: hypothetical protein H8E84_05015 [Flavobacteriales bacterium]|nr:hypothetical protein [Flavobacteriales bacterium]
MKAKYKKDEYVVFNRVSKKYACRYGKIIDVVKCYTDGNLRYPNHPTNKDLNITTNPKTGDFICYGYLIKAFNNSNQAKEIIIITEGFIKALKNV